MYITCIFRAWIFGHLAWAVRVISNHWHDNASSRLLNIIEKCCEIEGSGWVNVHETRDFALTHRIVRWAWLCRYWCGCFLELVHISLAENRNRSFYSYNLFFLISVDKTSISCTCQNIYYFIIWLSTKYLCSFTFNFISILPILSKRGPNSTYIPLDAATRPRSTHWNTTTLQKS